MSPHRLTLCHFMTLLALPEDKSARLNDKLYTNIRITALVYTAHRRPVCETTGASTTLNTKTKLPTVSTLLAH